MLLLIHLCRLFVQDLCKRDMVRCLMALWRKKLKT
jgi:hypothetical protein